jgi:hypothetical protein
MSACGSGTARAVAGILLQTNPMLQRGCVGILTGETRAPCPSRPEGRCLRENPGGAQLSSEWYV